MSSTPIPGFILLVFCSNFRTDENYFADILEICFALISIWHFTSPRFLHHGGISSKYWRNVDRLTNYFNVLIVYWPIWAPPWAIHKPWRTSQPKMTNLDKNLSHLTNSRQKWQLICRHIFLPSDKFTAKNPIAKSHAKACTSPWWNKSLKNTFLHVHLKLCNITQIAFFLEGRYRIGFCIIEMSNIEGWLFKKAFYFIIWLKF